MQPSARQRSEKYLAHRKELLELREKLAANGSFADAIEKQRTAIKVTLKALTESPFKDFADAIIESQRESEKVTPAVLQHLLNHSWFIGGWTYASLGTPIKRLIDEGREAEIDDFMAAAFREAAPDILEELCRFFPLRARILRDAFEAHATGKYTLSVPAMLAQADGILFDLTKQIYFMPSGDRTRLRSAIGGAKTDFEREVLKTLLLPGKLRENDRSENTLSRHLVMHGQNLSYANEISSLKCISLLDYVYLVGEMFHEAYKSTQTKLSKPSQRSISL
jgi:hypothetical protein